MNLIQSIRWRQKQEFSQHWINMDGLSCGSWWWWWEWCNCCLPKFGLCGNCSQAPPVILSIFNSVGRQGAFAVGLASQFPSQLKNWIILQEILFNLRLSFLSVEFIAHHVWIINRLLQWTSLFLKPIVEFTILVHNHEVWVFIFLWWSRCCLFRLL